MLVKAPQGIACDGEVSPTLHQTEALLLFLATCTKDQGIN